MSKKKMLLTIGIVLVMIIVGIMWLNFRGRALSPSGYSSFSEDDFNITIEYSRPSVRNRLIFGPEGSKALLIYGKYWRLGANEPTTIQFNQDVMFNNKAVSKGKYRMYAIPGEKEFEIILNTKIGAWGYSEPDHSKDLIKIKVPVIKQNDFTEQLTIDMIKTDSLNIEIKWANILLSFPVLK